MDTKKTPPRLKGTITLKPGSREFEVKVVEATDSPVERLDEDFILPPANSTASPIQPLREITAFTDPIALAYLPGALGPMHFPDGSGGKAI